MQSEAICKGSCRKLGDPLLNWSLEDNSLPYSQAFKGNGKMGDATDCTTCESDRNCIGFTCTCMRPEIWHLLDNNTQKATKLQNREIYTKIEIDRVRIQLCASVVKFDIKQLIDEKAVD